MANKDFYKSKAEKAAKANRTRPTTWDGGRVAGNQTAPKDGSRKSFDPKRAGDYHDHVNDADTNRSWRSGKLETIAAREAATKAADRAGKKLTRAPRAGSGGLGRGMPPAKK